MICHDSWYAMICHEIPFRNSHIILTVLECKSKLLDGTPFMSKPTLCFEDGAKCTTAQLLQVVVGLPWQARRWKWQSIITPMQFFSLWSQATYSACFQWTSCQFSNCYSDDNLATPPNALAFLERPWRHTTPAVDEWNWHPANQSSQASSYILNVHNYFGQCWVGLILGFFRDSTPIQYGTCCFFPGCGYIRTKAELTSTWQVLSSTRQLFGSAEKSRLLMSTLLPLRRLYNVWEAWWMKCYNCLSSCGWHQPLPSATKEPVSPSEHSSRPFVSSATMAGRPWAFFFSMEPHQIKPRHNKKFDKSQLFIWNCYCNNWLFIWARCSWPAAQDNGDHLRNAWNVSAQDRYHKISEDIVDGRNPAPVDVENLPLFTGFYFHQQDFFHQQYHKHSILCI